MIHLLLCVAKYKTTDIIALEDANQGIEIFCMLVSERALEQRLRRINLVLPKSPADPLCPAEFKKGMSFLLNLLLNFLAFIFSPICYHV